MAGHLPVGLVPCSLTPKVGAQYPRQQHLHRQPVLLRAPSIETFRRLLIDSKINAGVGEYSAAVRYSRMSPGAHIHGYTSRARGNLILCHCAVRRARRIHRLCLG